MSWKRAVHPEQKAQRRAEVLAVAGALVDDGGLEAAGLNAIARGVGFAKANLYRYFESREAILIQLMLDAFEGWASAVVARVDEIDAGLGFGDRADAVAGVLCSEMRERERMCVLLSSLTTVLEQNVDEQTVIDMKRAFYVHMEPLVGSLMRVFDGIDAEQLGWFLQAWMTGACQLWTYAHPAEVVKRVLAMEEFADRCVDFDRDSQRLAVTLLRGMRQGD